MIDAIIAAASLCQSGTCQPAQTVTAYTVVATETKQPAAPLISTYTIITPATTNGLIFGRVHNGKFNGGKLQLRLLKNPTCQTCK